MEAQQITEVPEPKPGYSERMNERFRRCCREKIENGGLYADELPEIEALAYDEVVEENARESRRRRRKKLGLKATHPIDDAIKLEDPYKFDERFNELRNEYETDPEAWQAVEDEYKSVFGNQKYSSYDSYRNSRKKRIK